MWSPDCFQSSQELSTLHVQFNSRLAFESLDPIHCSLLHPTLHAMKHKSICRDLYLLRNFQVPNSFHAKSFIYLDSSGLIPASCTSKNWNLNKSWTANSLHRCIACNMHFFHCSFWSLGSSYLNKDSIKANPHELAFFSSPFPEILF